MPFSPINLPTTRPPRTLVLADTPALGMKMMTTQVIRGLSQRFPDGNIGVLTGGGGARFYENSPYPIEHIHTIDDDGSLYVNQTHTTAGSIKECQYDAVVALPFQEGIYADLVINERLQFPLSIGSNRFLGALLSRYSGDVFERYRFDSDVKDPGSIAVPDEYMGKAMLRYLEPLGIFETNMRPEAWMSENDIKIVDSRFEDIGVTPEDFVVTLNLCTMQGHDQRRIEALAEAVNKISGYWQENMSAGYGRLVFLANYFREQQERYFTGFQEALRQFPEFKAPVLGAINNSPGELARIISRSSYVITPETGTAHVAQALDVPVTVIYQSEGIKNGWMLPGGRVMPIISSDDDGCNVSADDVFAGSLSAMLQWCRK